MQDRIRKLIPVIGGDGKTPQATDNVVPVVLLQVGMLAGNDRQAVDRDPQADRALGATWTLAGE